MMTTDMNSLVSRFSRQLLLSEIGVDGQKRLAASRVLIIGCGGLGCPASLYLAAAGVGEIGLVDGDVVALDNLHRQIAFTEDNIGNNKAECAASVCLKLNATGGLKVTTYKTFLQPENAVDVLANYDVILDCTDNPGSRYLINDACVIAGKPLVSASALRWEGQLTIYDSRTLEQGKERKGPCYRCLFPEPPPPGAVGSCAVNGVVGPVVGVMGSLQALEAIKLVTCQKDLLVGRLLLFDGLAMNFRVIKLRSPVPDCVVCGTNPTITSLTVLSPNTAIYLNPKALCATPLKLIEPSDRLSPAAFDVIRKKKDSSYVLVDVRPNNHFQVGHIEDAINVPLSELRSRASEVLNLCRQQFSHSNVDKGRIITVCRRGNDSQRAVLILRDCLKTSDGPEGATSVSDIEGGVQAWRETVDASFILL